VIVVSLFCTVNVKAQGDVVVHTDPRLSLLLRKPHNTEEASDVSLSSHKAGSKTIHASSQSLSHNGGRKQAAVLSGAIASNAGGKPIRTVAVPVVNSNGKKITGTPPPPAIPEKTNAKTLTPQAIAANQKYAALANKPYEGINGHAAGWTPPIRHEGKMKPGKGYRVQIYSGPDRNKAIEIKREFMRHFPGVHTYITYKSPCFRVKVGDYRNRSDAVGMYKEANSMYSPSMIVPDIIFVGGF